MKGEQDGAMSDFRSFAPDLNVEAERITLSPFESHHLVGTNRARQGDEVILFNGSGLEWVARLVDANRKGSILNKISQIQYPETSRKITLAIALIKGKTFDVILRQAAELGVAQIQPLITEWTQVLIKDTESKMDRWRSQLIEACKQSGNPFLPHLNQPSKLGLFLDKNRGATSIVASLESDTQKWADLELTSNPILFVGPEGDFSPTEYQLLKEVGVQPVSLGNTVLRSETAVVSALSILKEQLSRDLN